MTPEQRQRLADLVARHPNMRVSTLMQKIQVDIQINKIRAEIGHKQPPPAELMSAWAGASEGLVL